MDIDFLKIEKKWQEKWEEEGVFHVFDNSGKPKYYNLEMFPYPSGSGLHMGHALNYTIGDIYARFKRMNGFNVLYPMGYDSFGLPAENAAIKVGEHPKNYTDKSIANFVKQQKALGLSYDWTRMIKTCAPEYYKWNQYFFLKFLQKGLVYRKKSAVNWCPDCNSVLANEQVHNGKCWRHHDTEVVIKPLEQWFIKTTKYAEELLEKIPDLKWPDKIKIMQKNWIGKSFGTEILFEINGELWPIFTTRPDTIHGVTFMVVSAQHTRLMELVTKEQKIKVEEFLKKLKSVSEKDNVDLEKEGVFTGSYAINPMTKKSVPVYAGNFVVADYGSGMVMAVPAHDQRDFDFAKKYKIEILPVIEPLDKKFDINKNAYTGFGKLINSGVFNKLDNETAKKEITKYLFENNLGKETVNYKLRDWLVSRQRYWGTPIPIIYCKDCGAVPVPEKELPVLLPDKVEFGDGNPLLSNEEWINVKCPSCRKPARRETDTMDTFFDSSWYYLRYCDNDNIKEPFSKEKVNYWMPVNQYIGGAEHACMHLIYARFFTKALRDLGFLKFDEPFLKLFNQGMLHGADGQMMSKSAGNGIDPLDVIKQQGADALRLSLMSFASPDSNSRWDEKILIGNYRFLIKFFEYFENIKLGNSSPRFENKLNKIIKEATNQIENFKYNLAIIKVKELFEVLQSEKEISKEDLEKGLKLLHPFCPHITEELWEKIGNKNFISLSEWPKVEEGKINDMFDRQEQAMEKIISDILNVFKIVEARGDEKSKVFVYVLPGEKGYYQEDEISKRVGRKVEVYTVNDINKYDPKNISKKTKPSKPGIYLE